MIRNDMMKNPKKYIFVCMNSLNINTMYPEDLGNTFVVQEIKKHKGFNTLISFINETSEYSTKIGETIVEVKQIESKPFFVD